MGHWYADGLYDLNMRQPGQLAPDHQNRHLRISRNLFAHAGTKTTGEGNVKNTMVFDTNLYWGVPIGGYFFHFRCIGR